ncbi:phosphotransferase [Proteus mirabilis]|uniref:phosphotransferase n=1 Tax=Proteus mirabilis TaxID=584 RepID=UPI0021BA7F13|nr:phosphotransferase [Proteus mirabilis]MCT8220590.1 phosphotransferase [Proteus mirabilis]MCT8255442.1 phosphotransferase [Proteus mirabilis]
MVFFQWLEGEHLTHQQLFGSHLKLLAHQIAKLHQQKPFGFPLDLWHELSVYWYHIDRKRLSPKWLRLHHDFLRQPRRTLIKYAPAHMDLHPENILLSDSGIKFIDWEYAADIDTADSLMTFFAANQLNSAQQTAFLHEYCAYHHYTELNNDQQNRQHPQQQSFYSVNVLKQRILSREPFILYMMLMWYEVRWQQTKDNAFLAMSEPLRRYFSLMN